MRYKLIIGGEFVNSYKEIEEINMGVISRYFFDKHLLGKCDVKVEILDEESNEIVCEKLIYLVDVM